MSLGVSNENADRYADRVIGWRKPPNPTDQGNEAELYRAAGLSYLPRGAPFAHTSELWLLQGMPPALVRRIMPFVTVFSGRPDINVFDAAPELVAGLPGMTPARLASFLNQRETTGANKDSLERLLGPGQPGATFEGSNAFRVTIDIAFHDGWRTGSEVVILLDAADEPFQILSWRNDITADLDQPQLAKRLR
jgi:general secretion pathway protein K